MEPSNIDIEIIKDNSLSLKEKRVLFTEDNLEGDGMDNERIQQVKLASAAFSTSMISRGGILDFSINIENTLTDIIAWCFYPTDYNWDGYIYSQLDEKGIILKATLLRQIDFNEKTKILKDILIAKKLLPWNDIKTLINNITKDLDHVRDFRNMLAHSPLDISKVTLDTLKYKKGEGTEDFVIIQYKKGRVIKQKIDQKRIQDEMRIMMRVMYRLIQLFALLKGDIEDAKVSESLSNLSNEETKEVLKGLGLWKDEKMAQ